MNTAEKKTRDSNLELLRIILMLAIIAHHYVVNSGLTDVGGVIFSSPTKWQSLFLLWIGAWGKTAINCFILITGYFMCKSNITTKKYVKLLAQIYFYRIIFYIIFALTGYQKLSVMTLMKLAIPVTDIGAHFTGAFVIFYLFIPFLNILIKSMTEKQHFLLLTLTGVVYILMATLPKFIIPINYVSWFSIVYLIAAYIRMYPRPLFADTNLWRRLSLIMIAISSISIIILTVLPPKIGMFIDPYYFVSDSNKILAVCVSLCLFLFFKNVKIPYNKYINAISLTIFGVLLIHADSDAMRIWLWKDLVDPVGHYNSIFMPLYVIVSVSSIFIICSLIDWLRMSFLEKPFMKRYDHYASSKK